jgi:hypothetical protein
MPIDVGKDVDGETISSCVVTPADAPMIIEAGPKLTKNQQTIRNDRLREVGIGVNRKADIYDNRRSISRRG